MVSSSALFFSCRSILHQGRVCTRRSLGHYILRAAEFKQTKSLPKIRRGSYIPRAGVKVDHLGDLYGRLVGASFIMSLSRTNLAPYSQSHEARHRETPRRNMTILLHKLTRILQQFCNNTPAIGSIARAGRRHGIRRRRLGCVAGTDDLQRAKTPES